MHINILAFGIAKEILGARKVTLILSDVATVSDLRKKLISQYPEFEKLRSLAMAVNENYVSDDLFLSDNDEVVIIPPVSGG